MVVTSCFTTALHAKYQELTARLPQEEVCYIAEADVRGQVVLDLACFRNLQNKFIEVDIAIVIF